MVGEKASSDGSHKDLEQGIAPDTRVTALPDKDAQESNDPNIVGWDGPDDPENPVNWSFKKKMATTVIISTITLVT